MVAFWVGVWLALCALWDWRTRTVPNALTLPALGLGTLWMLRNGGNLWPSLLLALAWWWLWAGGAVGGADAKIGMALSLMNPGWGYAAMAGLVAAGLWAKTRRWRGRPVQDIPAVPFMAGMWGGLILTAPLPLAIIKASIVGVVCLSHQAQTMGFLF